MCKTKPKPSRIYAKNHIIYSCPKCSQEFNIYEKHEKFCHNCGQEIDWNIPTYLKEDYDAIIEHNHLDEISYVNTLLKGIKNFNDQIPNGLFDENEVIQFSILNCELLALGEKGENIK